MSMCPQVLLPLTPSLALQNFFLLLLLVVLGGSYLVLVCGGLTLASS